MPFPLEPGENQTPLNPSLKEHSEEDPNDLIRYTIRKPTPPEC